MFFLYSSSFKEDQIGLKMTTTIDPSKHFFFLQLSKSWGRPHSDEQEKYNQCGIAINACYPLWYYGIINDRGGPIFVAFVDNPCPRIYITTDVYKSICLILIKFISNFRTTK